MLRSNVTVAAAVLQDLTGAAITRGLCLRFSLTRSSTCRGVKRRAIDTNTPKYSDSFCGVPKFKDMERYAQAIEALNHLQTNHSVVQQVVKERRKYQHLNLERAEQMLNKSGMSMEDLDSLKVIHVSGTKGKGSTCAFCESILRRRGLKTGMFTSPHLLSVTERIRIDGKPIGKEAFAHYFWDVYEKVVTNAADECKPSYFKFLTVLAFNVFWKENVDVAVMEVGIGGRYDCTNVVRKPVVCGITTLDIDHTSVLGSTLEEIAWQKAGIMKTGTPTFLDGCQSEGALAVIHGEGKKIGSRIMEVPKLSAYDWASFPPHSLGMLGDVFHRNASLALQLCRYFYDSVSLGKAGSDDNDEKLEAKPFKIHMEEALGLKLCRWPGRVHMITQEFRGQTDGMQYFLDGAHTLLSVAACKSWFKAVSRMKRRLEKLKSSQVFTVLIFNLTKEDRHAMPLLQHLSDCDFDKVIFTPNVVQQLGNTDNENRSTSFQRQMQRCAQHADIWNVLDQKTPALVVESINEALETVRFPPTSVIKVQVLITGSLLLVGNALQLIEPTVCYAANPDEERRISALYMKLNQQQSS